MRHLIFIFLIMAMIIIAGCTSENKITNTSPTRTPIDLHQNVDVSALQAKYGIYGSCSGISRTSLEISHNDAMYTCSDPTKSIQFDNEYCFFNGHYIDAQLRYDVASLSTEICAREEAGRGGSQKGTINRTD